MYYTGYIVIVIKKEEDMLETGTLTGESYSDLTVEYAIDPADISRSLIGNTVAVVDPTPANGEISDKAATPQKSFSSVLPAEIA